MINPMAATAAVPTTTGQIHWIKLTWELARPRAPPLPTRCRWTLSAI